MATNSTTTSSILDAMRERARQAAQATPTAKRAKTPKACACGCGGTTRGGVWLPGHDAKAYSRMIAEERTALAAKARTAGRPTPTPGA